MGEPALEFNPFTGTLDWVAQPDSVSEPGEFTVPVSVNVGDLVYPSGNLQADKASNAAASTQAVAVVVAKPTTTSATLLFMGKVSGFAGLTAGSSLFLGSSGAIVVSTGLPTAPGSIIQRIGTALDTTTFVLDIQLPVVL